MYLGKILILTTALAGSAYARPSAKEQAKISIMRMSRNISPNGAEQGAIVASPSRVKPDYFFHWVRDAALVTNVMIERYLSPMSIEEKTFMERNLFAGAKFAKKLQFTPNPSGGLGEPKFNADGTAFTGPWGRPQNDGPALRAMYFSKFAFALIKENKTDFARSLYFENSPLGIIKTDLEYTAKNWFRPSFDIWEEVMGMHFYTMIVQKRALEVGGLLAQKMGDEGAARFYLQQAQRIGEALGKFYDSNKNFIRVTLNRTDGLDYKNSQLDSAVILGVIHADYKGGAFSPMDDRVMATAARIRNAFSKIYPVNGELRAPSIGRYPEDRYDGYRNDRQGNPWFISTHAFAEYNAKLAKQMMKMQTIPMSRGFREYLYVSLPEGELRQKLLSTRSIQSSNPLFAQLVHSIRLIGLEYLEKSLAHVSDDGRMFEQINRHSGFMQGAEDLTWSYSSYLSAYQALFTAK